MKNDPDVVGWGELTGWMIRNHPWMMVKIIWRVIRRPFWELVSFLLAVDVAGDLNPDYTVSPVTFLTAFAFIWLGARFVFIFEVGRVSKADLTKNSKRGKM